MSVQNPLKHSVPMAPRRDPPDDDAISSRFAKIVYIANECQALSRLCSSPELLYLQVLFDSLYSALLEKSNAMRLRDAGNL